MSRDGQRGHVYEAEQLMRHLLDNAAREGLATIEVAGSTVPVPIERKFGDLAAVQRYVDLVLQRVAEDYGVSSKVRVRARKGNAYATYQLGEIAVPDHDSWDRSWAMREIVVLHEIAHHLTHGHRHGPKFLAAFVDIVDRFMGPEAALILRVLSHESGARSA